MARSNIEVWQGHTHESVGALPGQNATTAIAATISLSPGCCPAPWSWPKFARVFVRFAEARP